MKTNAMIAALLMLSTAGCGDGLLDPTDALTYQIEGRASDANGEPVAGVKITVYGLDRDRFSYVIESVLTDSLGEYLLRWRGSATNCPEPYPGMRPPGYYVTATKEDVTRDNFTVVCGQASSTWMIGPRVFGGPCPSCTYFSRGQN
jgi:hypothetical protein